MPTTASGKLSMVRCINLINFLGVDVRFGADNVGHGHSRRFGRVRPCPACP
jgi:hypothetical protein